MEVWPPLRFDDADTAPNADQVSVAAVIGPPESKVTGPAQGAPTSRQAKDRAVLALLARLAGIRVPGREPAAGEPEPLVLPGMCAEVFAQRLRRAIEAGRQPDPALEAEALHRARAGRLRHRELYLLLLDAHGPPWAAVREAALQRAAAMPPSPARLLHWHAEQHGADHGLTYIEDVDDHGVHHTRAQVTTGRGHRLARPAPPRCARRPGTTRRARCSPSWRTCPNRPTRPRSSRRPRQRSRSPHPARTRSSTSTSTTSSTPSPSPRRARARSAPARRSPTPAGTGRATPR